MSCVKHRQYLDTHCRVCAKAFGKHTKYLCKNSLPILQALGTDLTNDDENIHLCNSCYLTSKRVSPTSSSTRPTIIWAKHNDSHREVCDVKCKGGRRKKSTSSGRLHNIYDQSHVIFLLFLFIKSMIRPIVTVSHALSATLQYTIQ